jgi:hypothetical protein
VLGLDLPHREGGSFFPSLSHAGPDEASIWKEIWVHHPSISHLTLLPFDWPSHMVLASDSTRASEPPVVATSILAEG